MASATSGGEVSIRQYRDYPQCDVIVVLRGREMVVRLPDHAEAIKWARMKCKAYKISQDFLEERPAIK